MRPVYEDKWVKLYEGDCLEVARELGAGAGGEPLFDHIITDPPYAAKTHEGARTRKDVSDGEDAAKLVKFASITYPKLKLALEAFAPLVTRWVISTVDYHHAAKLEEDPPAGLRFIRMGIWVKPGSAPQFSGDRPGMGWEAIAFLHRKDTPLAWNGGGRNSVFTHRVERGLHPTQKPIALISEFIQLFTGVGETIFDPFCGSGTVLRAAKDLRRRAVGIELDPKFVEVSAQRSRQEALPFAEVGR
jgi:site-specific DNA-methyltransferase (adenine-specific)